MTTPKKTATQRARERWADQQAKVDAQRTAGDTAAAEPEQQTLPGMPPTPPKPAPIPRRSRSRMGCHHCGTQQLPIQDRLCEPCRESGADPVWIPCTVPGHDHVRRRRRIGEQTFCCLERSQAR